MSGYTYIYNTYVAAMCYVRFEKVTHNSTLAISQKSWATSSFFFFFFENWNGMKFSDPHIKRYSLLSWESIEKEQRAQHPPKPLGQVGNIAFSFTKRPATGPLT